MSHELELCDVVPPSAANHYMTFSYCYNGPSKKTARSTLA